jgi:hypothetical protein
MRLLAAQLRQDIHSPNTRHLLVEQDQVVSLIARQRQRVITIRGRVHVVTALPQEEEVGLEELDLVIDPENTLIRQNFFL